MLQEVQGGQGGVAGLLPLVAHLPGAFLPGAVATETKSVSWMPSVYVREAKKRKENAVS